jgi:hypothetical protein
LPILTHEVGPINKRFDAVGRPVQLGDVALNRQPTNLDTPLPILTSD